MQHNRLPSHKTSWPQVKNISKPLAKDQPHSIHRVSMSKADKDQTRTKTQITKPFIYLLACSLLWQVLSSKSIQHTTLTIYLLHPATDPTNQSTIYPLNLPSHPKLRTPPYLPSNPSLPTSLYPFLLTRT